MRAFAARPEAAMLVFLCVAIPWLNPFAAGPSPWLQPWLVCLFAGAVLVAATGADARGIDRRFAALCLAFAAVVLARSGLAAEALAAVGGVALMLVCSGVPAGLARQGAVRQLALAWAVASLIGSMIALVQYFGFAQHFGGWIHASAAGEALGNLRQRNQLATMTSIGLAALLTLDLRSKALAGGCVAAVVMAAANTASTSRTGLVQLVALGLLAVLWRAPGRRALNTLLLAAAIAFCAAQLLLPALLENLREVTPVSLIDRVEGSGSCGSRRVLWSNVLQLIAARPWVGWGWGELDYAHYATLYPGMRFCDILDNAHNLPLQLAVELGVPAALGLCVAIGWLVLRARPWRETDAGRQLAWTILLLIFLHSMVEYPLWYGPFQMAAGMAVGLLGLGRATAAAMKPLWATWALRSGIALLACIGVYSAWDYHRASQLYVQPEQRDPRWRDDTLAKAGASWLFRTQVDFAELTITPLTAGNAAHLHALANRMLHFSPEPRVVEKVIEAAVLEGDDADAAWHMARFRAAFPKEYAAWQAGRTAAPAATAP